MSRYPSPYVLPGIIRTLPPEMITSYIKQLVCDLMGVDQALLPLKTRKREIVEARQYSIYLIKITTKLSLKRIGQEFGDRDHSTVIHAINAVNDLLYTYRSHRANMSTLIAQLQMRNIHLINTKDTYHETQK